MNNTEKLHPLSAETSADVFELPDQAAAEKLVSDINVNWPGVMNWTRGLARQLPVEDLGNTPYYYEAADIHHQPSNLASWLVEEKEAVFEWLTGLRSYTELVEECPGSTKVRLLDLHCPALPHCSTTFGRSRETEEKKGFQMEIVGFGGGSTHTVTFGDTLGISAREQCLEVWVPLRYTARRYRLKKAGRESFIYTVKATGIGEDIQILPAPCKGEKCSVIAPFDKPKATYTIAPAATLSNEIRYKSGSAMKSLAGIDLPWKLKIGLEVNVEFNYAVEYSFSLEGPGNYRAYDISYLSPRAEANGQRALESRTLIETLGLAWAWNKDAE